jgi:hypothetical protein
MRYGIAAVVEIGIGWPGSVVSSIHYLLTHKEKTHPANWYIRGARRGMRAGGCLCDGNRSLEMGDTYSTYIYKIT